MQMLSCGRNHAHTHICTLSSKPVTEMTMCNIAPPIVQFSTEYRQARVCGQIAAMAITRLGV